MSYNAFLLLMSQLASKTKVRIVINEHVLFFESSQRKNHLKIYTKVFIGDGYLPKSVCDCVSCNGMLKWQQSGAYLKLDMQAHSVLLIEELEIQTGKYIPFKHHLNDFSLVANEWREILQELADEDYSSLRIN